MDEREFKERTKQIALRVIRVVESLPKTMTGDVLGRQLLRSGTSIGANYRAACRGRSTADVVAKLGIVEEEADESIFWIELLIGAKLIRASQLTPLLAELGEILAMTVASQKTLRKRLQPKNRKSAVATTE